MDRATVKYQNRVWFYKGVRDRRGWLSLDNPFEDSDGIIADPNKVTFFTYDEQVSLLNDILYFKQHGYKSIKNTHVIKTCPRCGHVKLNIK